MTVLYFSIDFKQIEACGTYIKYNKILPLSRLLRKYYPNYSLQKRCVNCVDKIISKSSTIYGDHIHCLREILSTGSYDFENNNVGTEKLSHLLQLTHDIPINLNIINFYDINKILNVELMTYKFCIILLCLENRNRGFDNFDIKQAFPMTKLPSVKYIFENPNGFDFCEIMDDYGIIYEDKDYIIDQVKRIANENMSMYSFNIVTQDKKVIDIKTNLKQLSRLPNLGVTNWLYIINLLLMVVNKSDNGYKALEILFKLNYSVVQNLNEIIKDYFVDTIENGNYKFTYIMVLNCINKLHISCYSTYNEYSGITKNKEFLTAIIIAVNTKGDDFLVDLKLLIKKLPFLNIGICFNGFEIRSDEEAKTLEKKLKISNTFKELYNCNAYDSSDFVFSPIETKEIFDSIMPNGKLTKPAVKH